MNLSAPIPRYFSKDRTGSRIDEATSSVMVITLQQEGLPLIYREVENLGLLLFAEGTKDSFYASEDSAVWRVVA